MSADEETSPRATVRLGWRLGLNVFRSIVQAEQEARDELPRDYRPPAGKWVPGREMRAVRLEDTAGRQDVLVEVVKVFDEGDDQSVAAWSWLDVRTDESGVERVAVLVGTHLIGFLPTGDGKAVEASVRRGAERRKVVWVDTFIERKAGIFVADVNLP